VLLLSQAQLHQEPSQAKRSKVAQTERN